MNPEMKKELKKDRARPRTAEKSQLKTSDRVSRHVEKGERRSERLFPDLHVGLFEKEERERAGHCALFGREGREADRCSAIPECFLHMKLADTVDELNQYLQPEKRTGGELKTIHSKLSELERTLMEYSKKPGGLPEELQKLLTSVRKKKQQLERIDRKNAPVNPEALRSFEEVGAGIESLDAADWMVSDLMEKVTRILNGQQTSADGMSTEDLEHLVNEIDAMGSRHRYTKEQMSLDQMEQESLGLIINHPNKVKQEATEIQKGPQVRRETGPRGESQEMFEFRKGKEERDALGKKHEILQNITLTNRNNLHQKMEKDGLEAVRGMMHNGERRMGYAPLAAMGLGGNLYRGFSGVNYLLSMTPLAMGKSKKSTEVRGVMERYLGLDQLYRNFMTKNSDIRNRTAFLKRYGIEENVRVMIQKEQNKALGKGAENRMNSFVMKKYAKELWNGAFLKDDGSVITERERQAEEPKKKQERKLYADMLRAMGFDIRYPTTEGAVPGISDVDIFKRLLP